MVVSFKRQYVWVFSDCESEKQNKNCPEHQEWLSLQYYTNKIFTQTNEKRNWLYIMRHAIEGVCHWN